MKPILLIGALIATINTEIKSCTCIGESSTQQSLKASDLVVIGKVIGKKEVKIWSDTTEFPLLELNPITLLDYTVVISKRYKGRSKNNTIIVRTGFGHGDCGFVFNIGDTYLIYAVREYSIKYRDEKLGRSKRELRGTYNTNICTRTKPLNRATEDLLELK